jgi:hypothetical protein
MWSLHSEPTSSKGEKILQVMGVASTLWPIAFAAVLGPMLKTVALYNAERGVKLRVRPTLLLDSRVQEAYHHAGS